MSEILKIENGGFVPPKKSLRYQEKTKLSINLSQKLQAFDQKLHCEELMAIKLSGVEIF
ncbi:hypothetical protein [Polynucleobacter asymbioticus]|uniref:hypothetical protein n=1 Tax=Polynucleobacter asymbioticus TaxID=576611 RepID=UPI0016714CC1|nr:hypothetical protein [Polynucleobacter asymbioticus]